MAITTAGALAQAWDENFLNRMVGDDERGHSVTTVRATDTRLDNGAIHHREYHDSYTSATDVRRILQSMKNKMVVAMPLPCVSCPQAQVDWQTQDDHREGQTIVSVVARCKVRACDRRVTLETSDSFIPTVSSAPYKPPSSSDAPQTPTSVDAW